MARCAGLASECAHRRQDLPGRTFPRRHRAWALETVIEGGAKGADQGAAQWAEHEGVTLMKFPADWATFGRSAGPRRNAQMLSKGQPDVVIAFPGGRGTANMVAQAKAAGVTVILVENDQDH
jgi:hypothetical protein